MEFLKAAQLSPDDAKIYGFVAASYKKLGNQDKAEEYYRHYQERMHDSSMRAN